LFEMGCLMPSAWFSCSTTSLPVHPVTLTRPVYMGRYEVTQAQWVVAMGSNPSYFQSASSQVAAAAVPNRPVERVSWNSVQGFLTATGFRLPTDAEWEFSCRAGTQSPFYNGSTWDPSVAGLAWYSDNAASETHPVGGKSANALGLHDMLGNVWELAHDWNGPYSSGAQVDPTGASSGTSRVRRGGSWFLSTVNVNSSYRIGIPSAYAVSDMGFRVARDH
jgi:formylglycine-generating enzyme required for sulfatase activity